MKPWVFLSSKHEEPPWSPSFNEAYTVIDFRRRSCNRNHVQSGYDGPNMFDASIPQYDESNFFQPVNGILMVVHSPDEYPMNTGQHRYIVYWARNDWIFYPEMFLIDDELKSWSIEKRSCYLTSEKKLEYFKIYTKNNCEHECLSLLISEKCGCVPFYLIRKKFFTANPSKFHDFICRRSIERSVWCS